MPIYIGTCFRFYKQMRVEKNPKHLHIESIVTSHNSVQSWLMKANSDETPHFLLQILSRTVTALSKHPESSLNSKSVITLLNNTFQVAKT